MITVPVWLFAVLLGITGSSGLTVLWVWNRAQATVTRILAEELYLPPVSDQEASDRADRGQSDG